MLHSFSYKNFYSLNDAGEVSFVVNDNAPDDNSYFLSDAGVRLSRIETVIGPNASGKTNLLKVLPFLKWLIIDSFESKPDEVIAMRPFAFGPSREMPTELGVVFEVEGRVYAYFFKFNQKQIFEEKLSVTEFVKKKSSTKTLFSRTWDEKTQAYEFNAANFALASDFDTSLLRRNASVVGTLLRFNHKESSSIARFWESIETNVAEAGWVGDRVISNSLVQLHNAINFFGMNEDLKKEAEKIISRFDLGLAGFQINKRVLDETKDKGPVFILRASHLFNGQEHLLPLQYESSGTRQLFIILKSLLSALANGGVAIVDEFDVNLHPEVVLALFGLFIDKAINSKNAQLLLSTHSLALLNKLSKYQIVLVEKNKNGESVAWRLDELGSGVRADDNYYAKYIAGAYGGLPDL